MKATRLLAALFGAGSVLLLADMIHPARHDLDALEIEEDDRITLSFHLMNADARQPVDAYFERLEKFGFER